ncbi:MAG: DUF2007 domain-containing protein [Cyclobacteriaceae bacterium]|nr:DUF2007 domain-containing protein [Cyclobacteriaceae bacterium]
MEKEEEIIVFQEFDTSIDANIVKTKLDAFGVPCFLTEENMSNLYPGTGYTMLAFRVRLHLFARDAEKAREILQESQMQTDGEVQFPCPRCRSNNIARDFPRHFNNKIVSALGVLFLGIFFPHKKVNHCLSCDHEFTDS